VSEYLALIAGLVCAGLGGELFVRAAVGLARWARVAPGIIAATVAGFATSSPELTVSVNAALAGRPQIALGDALGSNMVNVALILALALVVSPIQCSRQSIARDFPVALLVPTAIGILASDGVLSRFDGAVMLCVFAIWLAATVREARAQRSAAAQVLAEPRATRAAATGVVGLILLIAAGHLIVVGARGLAATFGLHEFVVGATVVAAGTSVPELATAVVAKLRSHDEVGLGTILGSNIFNGLFIVPVAATIHPIAFDWGEAALALICGMAALAIAYPSHEGLIPRQRGLLLLSLYAAYLAALLSRASGAGS